MLPTSRSVMAGLRHAARRLRQARWTSSARAAAPAGAARATGRPDLEMSREAAAAIAFLTGQRPSGSPRTPRYTAGTNVRAALSQANLTSDDLARLFVHSLSQQTAAATHDQDVADLLQRMVALDPRAVTLASMSMIVSYASKYEFRQMALFRPVLPVVCRVIQQADLMAVDQRYLSTLAHSLTRFIMAGHALPDMFHTVLPALASAAHHRIDQIDEVGLGLLAWSYARVDPRPDLMAAIARSAAARIASFPSSSLSIMLWAFARVDSTNDCTDDVFREAAREVIARLAADRQCMTPQQLSNIVWAFAKAGRVQTDLFVAVGAALVGRIGQCAPASIANTVWAYAAARLTNKALFDGMARQALRRMGEFRAQDLAMTAWAFTQVGRANADHAALYGAMARATTDTRRLGQFQPHDVALMAMAYAPVTCIDADDLFRGLARHTIRLIDEFDPFQVANVAWAVAARAGALGPGLVAGDPVVQALLQAMARSALHRLHRFPGPALAALAQVQARCAAQIDRALFAAVARVAADMVDDLGPSVPDLVRAFDDADRRLQQQQQQQLANSDVHRILALTGLASAFIPGRTCAITGLQVDYACDQDGRQVAIDCNLDDGQRFAGGNDYVRLRRLLLRRSASWVVIDVDAGHWVGSDTDKTKVLVDGIEQAIGATAPAT